MNNVYWPLHYMENTEVSLLNMGIPCYGMVSKYSSIYTFIHVGQTVFLSTLNQTVFLS